MNDRELLEAAAKAAGLTHLYCEPWQGMAKYNKHLDEFYGPIWNPLTDDGDALRLVVALRLEVDVHHTGIAVRTPNGIKVLIDAEDEPNAYAATRRAIVRAAAAIGGVA